ncbi:MAG TPA: ribosome biogenesis factor YjgA [Rhodanobacteraceae bacterium]|jgi:ribosome-associated protein|nr:ribosome biogenesis factor YjgA [Rhodanobacteraceae bacterium]
MPVHEQPEPDRPSRSARRRGALDVLALARALSELPPARLDKLGLPDDVRDELAEVQRTPSHIAHKRQLAHLAKRMRAHDEEAFASARSALANDRAAGAREAAELHRAETLREKLLGEEGDAALTSFIAEHPDADRQRMRALIRQARRERETGKPARAQRELFRLLRKIDAEQP